MVAIETHALSKQYGPLKAVNDLNLRVERGEVFGFLGPNGAGKSTTINMLLDFVRPTAGEVSVLGFDPQREPRAVSRRVGVLPEATGYYERATAREHVRFAIEMKRASDDPDAILNRVGIATAADRPVGGFSTGMRQRLGLGIALVGGPDLLILDEPLTGLDPSGAKLLREIVRTERDRGTTVFLSSHVMNEIEALCNRVGIMNDGELIAVDTIDHLRTTKAGADTFVIRLDEVPPDHNVTAVDGVTDVTVRGDTLRITCTEPTVKAAVVSHLDATGATIIDIDSDPVSIEEIFLQITDGGTDG